MLIIKVPALNGLGKTQGCEKAPEQIIGALKDIYSNESGKEITFEQNEIEVNNKNIEETNKNIFNKASEVLDKDFVIFLGGDHSISYSLFSAFREKFRDKNPGLLIFDAHTDCTNNFKPPTHEDWLRVLIEEGFSPENVILVGPRNIFKNKAESDALKGVSIFSCGEIFENIKEACNLIMEAARKFDVLYISIDIDVIDPAFAPGTFYIEPAGLTSRELIYLLQHLRLLKNLKALDLVEINPKKDINNLTVKLGAKIIAELL